MSSLLPLKTDLSALNEEQHQAVTSQEKRILVLAGAGSGKTKTLLQKIIYLVEEKGVSPTSILAITFTKNAANEMVDRLIMSADNSGAYERILFDKKVSAPQTELARQEWRNKYKWINGLTLKTFHSFCYSVLRNYGAKEFDNRFRIIGDEAPKDDDEFSKYVASETVIQVFQKLLIIECENPEYLLRLKRYILDYFVDGNHKKKNENTYSTKEGKFFTTLNGNKVRSKSEQAIADWLYRHNIPFEYEPQLNVSDFSFHPDFYIPAANLYIEHVSNLSYKLEDKEKQFNKGKILLAKTYEEQTKDSAYFNLVLDNLIRGRLPADYNKTVELNFQEEFKTYLREVAEFSGTAMRIMNMIKVENTPIETIQENASKDQHERVRDFYSLALPIIEKYNAYCVDKSYLDFNDMITRAITVFQSQEDISNYYRTKIQYVLVDEFQDVNNLQVDLIKLMLTDQTQLFCVGDDWQSIYGFRGSNVSYTIEFEKHFMGSQLIKLNLNYRSTQHIVGASNEVISHNKIKIEKEIRASKISEHKIVVYAGNDEEENVDFCVSTVQQLMEDGVLGDEIMFLYRRTNMYWTKPYSNTKSYSSEFAKKGIKILPRTIHAAKGLEAKVVFILGLTEGYGGFPDIWMEDRLFQVIKSVNRDLLLEEERRLFYVAITRAKEKLYLITEKGNESSFLKEIPETYTVKTGEPIKSLEQKISLCKKCFSQLEKLWVVCPYCAEPISHSNK
ncbi:MAG: UvrD-helicase domain-containing protein [Saprospiraceae bacterium]